MEKWSRQIDFNALGRYYGTPLYVFNEQQLHDNIKAYLRLTGVHLLYPVKANPSLAVLTQLAEYQCGADCASAAEVHLAQQAGIPLEHIVYNTPCPDYDLVLFLLQNKAMVVVDSLEFLFHLASGLGRKRMPGKLLLRLNPGLPLTDKSDGDRQSVLAHGAASSKFGIASDDLLLLKTMPLPIHGLHLHIGSRMASVSQFVTQMNNLHEMAHYLKEKHHQPIEYLDLGGGLGISYSQNAHYPTIDELVDALNPLRQPQYHYLVEPGNSLVGNTMGLLTELKILKTLRDRRWGIVDVGCDQLINPIALKTPHQILNSRHEALPFEGADALGGPLCFAGDVLLETTDLSGVAQGDFLFIQHTGAYCYALNNHFNGRYLGGIVSMGRDGEFDYVHRPENVIWDSNNLTYNPHRVGKPSESRLKIHSFLNFDIYACEKYDYLIKNKASFTGKNDWKTLMPVLCNLADVLLKDAYPGASYSFRLVHFRFSQCKTNRIHDLHLWVHFSSPVLEANRVIVHAKWLEASLGLEGEWVFAGDA